jgi:hypothetical protein
MNSEDRQLLLQWSAEMGLDLDADDWTILERLNKQLHPMTQEELLITLTLVIKLQYDNFRVSYRGLEVRFEMTELGLTEVMILTRLNWIIPWR